MDCFERSQNSEAPLDMIVSASKEDPLYEMHFSVWFIDEQDRTLVTAGWRYFSQGAVF
jgi:hypothetical protein